MSPARKTGIPLDRLLAGWVDVPAGSALEVSGLCHDSRALRAGDLFFALAGSRSHGMRHAAEASASGACAILCDPAQGGAELANSAAGLDIPCFPVEGLAHMMGLVADRFYGHPSSFMKVIGITGTNGKTSTSHFLAQALPERECSAVIGTLGWGRPGALKSTTHTTPDAIEVHGLLSKLLAKGMANVAMEASSHGLEQGRLNGVRFEGGVFTNFSRDHLDYHGSMQAYLEAKLRLVEWPGMKFIVFNLDDESADAIMGRAPVSPRKIGFTVRGEVKPGRPLEVVQASDICYHQNGISFTARFEGRGTRVSAPVYGDFNVENLLGVLAVSLAMGTDLDEASRGVAQVTAVPGRMERFTGLSGPTAVVDYAHTPDALHKALVSLRRHCRGFLWVVFGCGGDRDRGKRPQMGGIAERFADRVVVTDDNPRSEDGDSIINDILGGCERREITVIRDRRAAIFHALGNMGANDVVLVAGKGHEDTQEIDGVKYPFSDRDIIRSFLGQTEKEVSLCA